RPRCCSSRRSPAAASGPCCAAGRTAGGSRRGEIRLLFDARLLPAESASRTRTFWMALRHRLERDLPDLPVDDAHLEDAVLQGLRQLLRPVAVALLGGYEIDGADLDLLMCLLESGIRCRERAAV